MIKIRRLVLYLTILALILIPEATAEGNSYNYSYSYNYPWIITDSAFVIISLILVFACIPINWSLRKLPVSRAWFCIVFSLLMNFIGKILWLRDEILLGGPENIPYPGTSDPFFLLSYLLFGLALMIILRGIWGKMLVEVPKKEIITLSTVILSSAILAYALYSKGYFENPVYDTLYLLLPLVDATLSLFVMNFFTGRKTSGIWLYFALGNVTWAASESLWIIVVVMGVFGQSFMPDFLYLLGYAFYCMALSRQIEIIWLKGSTLF